MKTWPLIILAPAIGLLVGGWIHPWAVPILNAACFFPHFYAVLCRGNRLKTLAHALLWAAASTSTVVLSTFFFQGWTAAVVVHGESYRAEMFEWLQTGRGAEGQWRQFLPQHAFQLAAFVLACVVSGGFLGVVLGCYLLHYMAFYVGHLILAAQAGGGGPFRLIAVSLLGYSPWAVARVVGYVLLAISLSELFYRRIMPLYVWYPKNWWCAKAGIAMVLMDALLKGLLSDTWRRFVVSLVF